MSKRSKLTKVLKQVNDQVEESKDKGNPLTVFDLTVPCCKTDEGSIDKEIEELCTLFKGNCTKWAFQLEKGSKTGYLHYQCRITMACRKRLCNMIEWCQQQEILKGVHVSPTSDKTFRTGDNFYVLKEDTRVKGPFTDKTYVTPLKIPSHLQGTPNWYPWQKDIIKMMELPPSGEKVRVIINPWGGFGKTTLASWLAVRQKARRVPIMDSAKDVSRMVMNCPKVGTYFIDYPRAVSKNVSKQFASAIEEITNGYAWDDRYKWEEEFFEKPHVFIFTNCTVDEDLLTSRRWEFYTIVGSVALKNLSLLRIQEQAMAFNRDQLPKPEDIPIPNENIPKVVLNIVEKPHNKDGPTYQNLVPTYALEPVPEPKVVVEERKDNETLMNEIRELLIQLEEDTTYLQVRLAPIQLDKTNEYI